MISVTGFSKNYGETLAVQDLSFEAAGAILGMLGPNGAGKTTTLRAMAGILQPTAGRLSIGGHDIVQNPVAAKQQLALVPDDPAAVRFPDRLGASGLHRGGLPRARFLRRRRVAAGAVRTDGESPYGRAGIVAGNAAEGGHLLRLPAPAGGDTLRRADDRPGSPRHPHAEGFRSASRRPPGRPWSSVPICCRWSRTCARTSDLAQGPAVVLRHHGRGPRPLSGPGRRELPGSRFSSRPRNRRER